MIKALLLNSNEELFLLLNEIFMPDRSKNVEIYERKQREKNRLSRCYVIGIVAKLHAPKNIGRLIAIFKEIVEVRDDARLMIVGDGPDKDVLIQKTSDLVIQEKVLFLGMRNDVYCLMSAMDVFVLPSLFEGLGMVTIEAQTSGLRVVISNNVPTIDILGEMKVLSLDDGNVIYVAR